MTSRQTGLGMAHPTVVPASVDDERAESSEETDDEACPECGYRVHSRDQ